MVVTGTHAFAYYQSLQERELRVLDLEKRLAELEKKAAGVVESLPAPDPKPGDGKGGKDAKKDDKKKDDEPYEVGSDLGMTSKWNAGLQAEVQGDYATAQAKFEDLLKVDPSNKFANYNLGYIAQTVDKNNASAAKYYAAAIKTDPQYGPALYNLAIIKTANGDKAGANKMRAMAERPLLWRKTERELRRSAASHQGSFDWSAIFATLLPILIEKLKEWLTKK